MALGCFLPLLILSFLSLYACTILPQVPGKIAADLLEEHEQHAFKPSFGMKQLQNTAQLMHSLWTRGENINQQSEEAPNSIKRNTQTYTNEMQEWEYGEYKRDISDDNDGPPVIPPICTVGIQQYNVTLQNTCTPATCTVYEAICTNGTEVTTIYPNYTNFSNQTWSQCKVTKMMCFALEKREVIDMKEQYGVTNCTIDPKYYCWDIKPFGYTCVVQVTCSNYTNWGTYAWGLQCANDKVICNGTSIPDNLIDSRQREIINGECHIETRGCAENSQPPRNCTNQNLTCGYQTNLGTYGGCKINRMDVSCPNATAPTSNCSVSQILCNGTVLDASAAIPNQARCYLYSLNCNGNITVLPNSSCRPVAMVCNGTSTAFSTYTGALSQCVTSQVRCGRGTNCTGFELACPQAPKCALTQTPCNYSCSRMLNTSSCACPDDFTGRFCESHLQYNCTTSLVYPPLNCLPPPTADPKDALLSGDRKCIVFDDYQGTATLGFRLNCQFQNMASVNYSSLDFTYWAKNDKISISKQVDWYYRYKIFNFNQLSDSNATIKTGNLTVPQVLGDEIVWFNFSLKEMPERYWYARRLYFELSFNPAQYANMTYTRNFVDVPSRPISTKTLSKVTTFTLVIIFGSIAVFLGLVGYVGFKCYRAYGRTQRKEKY